MAFSTNSADPSAGPNGGGAPAGEKRRGRNATEVRRQLLANGYLPLPNLDKRCFLKGWPRVEIDDETINQWGKDYPRYQATGVRLSGSQNDLFVAAADLDIDDLILDRVIERLLKEVPQLKGAPRRGTDASSKVCYIFQINELFGRISSARYVRPGSNKDTKPVFVEIFGGASTRQIGSYGLHRKNEDEDKDKKDSFYEWHGNGLLQIKAADLPLLTKIDCFAIAGVVDAVLIEAGFVPVPESKGGEDSGKTRVYDLTPAMKFDTNDDDRTLGLADLIAEVQSEGRPKVRCSASFWDPSSTNRTRCIASTNSFGKLQIWDAATGILHLVEADHPAIEFYEEAEEEEFFDDAAEAAKFYRADNDYSEDRADESVGYTSIFPKETEEWQPPLIKQPVTMRTASGNSVQYNYLDALDAGQDDEADAFPIDALPTVLRGAVEAVLAHSHAPVALCATSALSTAAFAVQGHFDVWAPNIGTVPTSIYSMVLAESGERKSRVDTGLQSSIRTIESKRHAAYLKDHARYLRAAKVHAGVEKAILTRKYVEPAERERLLVEHDKLAPRCPLTPISIMSNLTAEGVVNHLKSNIGVVGVFTSEGGELSGGHSMTPEALIRTLATLSKLWSGEPLDRIRAKIEDSYHLAGRRGSICVSIQPVLAAALVNNPVVRRQGFLARFLLTLPQSKIGWRPIDSGGDEIDPRLLEFHSRMRALFDREYAYHEDEPGRLSPKVIRIEGAAFARLQEAQTHYEIGSRKGGEFEAMRETAAKAGEQIARLAAVMAVLEDDKIFGRGRPTVSVDMIDRAVILVAYFIKEAQRIFSHAFLTPIEEDSARLCRWLDDDWPGAIISARDLARSIPRSLGRNGPNVRRLITELKAQGKLRQLPVRDGHSGRPSERYSITGIAKTTKQD